MSSEELEKWMEIHVKSKKAQNVLRNLLANKLATLEEIKAIQGTGKTGNNIIEADVRRFKQYVKRKTPEPKEEAKNIIEEHLKTEEEIQNKPPEEQLPVETTFSKAVSGVLTTFGEVLGKMNLTQEARELLEEYWYEKKLNQNDFQRLTNIISNRQITVKDVEMLYRLSDNEFENYAQDIEEGIEEKKVADTLEELVEETIEAEEAERLRNNTGFPQETSFNVELPNLPPQTPTQIENTQAVNTQAETVNEPVNEPVNKTENVEFNSTPIPLTSQAIHGLALEKMFGSSSAPNWDNNLLIAVNERRNKMSLNDKIQECLEDTRNMIETSGRKFFVYSQKILSGEKAIQENLEVNQLYFAYHRGMEQGTRSDRTAKIRVRDLLEFRGALTGEIPNLNTNNNTAYPNLPVSSSIDNEPNLERPRASQSLRTVKIIEKGLLPDQQKISSEIGNLNPLIISSKNNFIPKKEARIVWL